MAEAATQSPFTGPRFTVFPKAPTFNQQAQPSIEDLPAYVAPEDQQQPGGGQGQSIEDLPAYVDTTMPSQTTRQVAPAEAAAVSGAEGVTLGFSPAIVGGVAAARATMTPQEEQQLTQSAEPSLEAEPGLATSALPIRGAARAISAAAGGDQQTLSSLVTGGRRQKVIDAYNQGRQSILDEQEQARQQQPGAYYPALIAGSLAAPIPGLGIGGAAATDAVRAAHALATARAAGANPAIIRLLEQDAAQATRAARVSQAAKFAGAGAVAGATQGVGQAVSEGGSVPDVVRGGVTGGVTGGVMGGVLGGVLPVRVAPDVLTSGQRAAQTAADLGAPLPRGVASDRPFVQATTAKLRQMPLAGERIGTAVEKTQEKAGERVEDIAGGMTGGTSTRAGTGADVQSGVEQAIQNNKDIADGLYDNVRGRIDEDARFTMPRTKAALDKVVLGRIDASSPNPYLGLDQFYGASEGVPFNGAQRVREIARNAGDPLRPHPGFDKGDFRLIKNAMDADLKGIVYQAAHGGPAEKQAAVDAFEKADKGFGYIAELNNKLKKIAGKSDEGGLGSLLGAAGEQKGNAILLRQLKATMPAEDFQKIGGQLLFEQGRTADGNFSLKKFVDDFEKLSPEAKQTLFDPQHLKNLEDIVQLGGHIKGALKESSTSHSAGLFVMIELAKSLHEIFSSGEPGMGAIGAGSTAALWTLTHWLANPAKTAAIRDWMSAYRVASSGVPTPGRVAALKIATRNLSHNLGVPVDYITRALQKPVAASPDETGSQKGQN